jgi:hypothetical protein
MRGRKLTACHAKIFARIRISSANSLFKTRSSGKNAYVPVLAQVCYAACTSLRSLAAAGAPKSALFHGADGADALQQNGSGRDLACHT